MTLKVRIGIDVGGTFTDAVAIDNETLEILEQIKVPTTHTSPIGVAEGIIESIKIILSSPKFTSEEVIFIAHGTTQATNALLEGDVVKVGIVGMSSGMNALFAKNQANIDDIELSQGRMLRTAYQYISTKEEPFDSQIEIIVKKLLDEQVESFVASESFSVDDPRNEIKVINKVAEMGYPATGTHQISKRYGLTMRTRTSVINASILPKMVQSANMTEESVTNSGITAPLMIMRGDGGAMSIDEMRKRPILTLLSGPAAGVAGALMYAKVSDGIFFEVGGTSTDISAIRNGQVLVDNAEIGGHNLYLPSLDIRTIGVAGGSLIRLRGGRIAEVGPRSAHIAGLKYVVYANPEEIIEPQLMIVRALPDDPEEYAVIKTSDNKIFGLTTSCAANILGLTSGGAFAAGNIKAALLGFAPLADYLGVSIEEAARMVLDKAIDKLIPPVQNLIAKYNLSPDNVLLVGGGGGASALIPYLSKSMKYQYEIVAKAEIISTIGVALALVRDVVERTINNPSNQDIIRIRKEAEMGVIKMGAVPETVEVKIDIDSKINIVRAIATGALEMRSSSIDDNGINPENRLIAASKSFGVSSKAVNLLTKTDYFEVYAYTEKVKQFFGLFNDRQTRMRVVDREGIVRLKLKNAAVVKCNINNVSNELKNLIDKFSAIKDTGRLIPNIFVLYGPRILNMTGLATSEQILEITQTELDGLPKDTSLILLAEKR